MAININWTGDCQFKVTTEKGFTVDIDSNGKVAPCPTEILLSALGSCSATDVVLALQDQGVKVESLRNTVTYTLTESKPRLYQSANLHFTVEGSEIAESELLSIAQEAVSKHCHVCLMLQPAIEISCSVVVV